MNLAPAVPSHRPVDAGNRRVLAGVLASLVLHGLVLLLQFGVPSLGIPGAAPPLSVRLAQVVPPPLAPPQPVQVPVAPPRPDPLPPVSQIAPPRPVTGMRLVDPVPAPPPPPVVAKPAVKKDKPRRARRISPPMPARETLDMPNRVITQDAIDNEFNIPVTRPEEAIAKTEDVKDAQHGEDDGEAASNAAAEAELARAGQMKAAQEAEERKLAEEKARQEEVARLAALEQTQRQEQERERLAQEQDARRQAEEQTAQQQREQQLAVQRNEQAKEEQRRAEQLEQQRAELQRAEQLKAEQQRAEQVRLEQQQVDRRLAEQQEVERQRAEQQRAEQQRAEQQRAEQQRAEQQRAEQQRAEQQRADQQRAEQARADQQAADQRARDLAAGPGTAAGSGAGAGSGARPGGSGGGGGGAAQIPKNMLGSDLANKARDLVRGLDVLSGAPPASRPSGGRRAVVGANERDLPLKMYVESWRQKLERNGTINYPRSWADMQRTDPLVNVAVRSDGSVEEVTILRSSGRADMDEAVRRIVRVNARYSPFPPKIAEKYDVIDIRRVWRFDDVLKLMEEVN